MQFQGASKPTRLNFHRFWRNEFDQMMASVNQGTGAAGAVPPPPAAPPSVPPAPEPPAATA